MYITFEGGQVVCSVDRPVISTIFVRLLAKLVGLTVLVSGHPVMCHRAPDQALHKLLPHLLTPRGLVNPVSNSGRGGGISGDRLISPKLLVTSSRAHMW